MFYPLRKFSPWLALIGLAAYIFLPRQKRGPDAIHYAGWRILLGDFTGFLLDFFFFSLPILIAGSSLQVIGSDWLLLALFFWVVILLAAWWLGYNAWYAAYSLELLPDRLQVFTEKGKREYLFREMLYIQPTCSRQTPMAIWQGKRSSVILPTTEMLFANPQMEAMSSRVQSSLEVWMPFCLKLEANDV